MVPRRYCPRDLWGFPERGTHREPPGGEPGTLGRVVRFIVGTHAELRGKLSPVSRLIPRDLPGKNVHTRRSRIMIFVTASSL